MEFLYKDFQVKFFPNATADRTLISYSLQCDSITFYLLNGASVFLCSVFILRY